MEIKKRIVILTKSAKHGHSCVAGIDVKNGEWIRLVTDDTFTDGAIPESYMQDDVNHTVIEPLDVIDVTLLKHYPTKYQPENYLIDINVLPTYVETMSLQQVAALVEKYHEASSSIFDNYYKVLHTDEMDHINKSLDCYCVNNLKVFVTKNHYGKNKSRADFSYNGHNYKGIHVTDKDFFDLEYPVYMRKAYLVMSLPHQFYEASDGTPLYFKFIAKIFPA